MTGTSDKRGLVVQPRDRRLFEEFEILRVVNREQAKIVAGFGSTTRANARLLALVRAGLLRRFFFASGNSLYVLSEKGAHIVGVPLRSPRRRQDEVLVADFFIEHQLVINEIYCAMKFRAIPVPGIHFRRWLAFHEQITESIKLIPDGYVELDTASGLFAAFLEVDLGHERGRVWQEKIERYKEFALSEESERQSYAFRFQVLVVANTERRMRALKKIVEAVASKGFWFTTLGAMQIHGAFAPIWFRPKGEAPTGIFEERP
jgi:hypothetical protein